MSNKKEKSIEKVKCTSLVGYKIKNKIDVVYLLFFINNEQLSQSQQINNGENFGKVLYMQLVLFFNHIMCHGMIRKHHQLPSSHFTRFSKINLP